MPVTMKADTGRKHVAGELPPVINRFELKYTIPYDLIGPISDYVSIYCDLDKYSLKSPDRFYMVNSLYLDTPNYHFLQRRLAGDRKRFNMRIRSYGEEPTAPYFLEIKRKDNEIINKSRARVTGPDWELQHHLPCTDFIKGDDPQEAENRDRFWRTVHTFAATPKVLLQYRRKAYISNCDDYARVTFDVSLRYMPEQSYNVHPRPEAMTACDVSTNFDSGCSVILELKCYTSFVPLWMIDLIKTFDLRRRGFSKYSSALRETFGRYGYAPDAYLPGMAV